MALHALEAMDGRQRGQIVRDSKGQFTTIAGRNADIDKEISEYYKKINHLKKFTSENPDLKVLIDDKKAEIAKLESEQRLNNFSRRGIKERTKAYEDAMKKQGMKGKELKEQVARYEEGLKEERKAHFDKLKGQNNAKNVTKNITEGVKIGEGAKESKGFFSRIGAALKANKGKIALATAAVAIGAGIVAMCSGSDKSEDTDFDENTVVPPEDTGAEEETPAAAEEPAAEEPAEETPAVETPAEETGADYEVKKGDCFWNIAKENLINKYKAAQEAKGEAVDENYKPSNAEILEETDRLMRKNKYEYDKKHYNSVPPLYVGDKISLAA